MTRRLLPVLVVAAVLACAGMGAVALEFDGEVVQLTGAQTGDAVWNSSNFGGFCYNMSDDACVGTETLTIAAYTLEGPDINRTIDEGCLIYTTSPTWREYELYRNLGLTVDGNSRYWVEFWMGEEYVAINRSGRPAKLLVEWDSTDTMTLATGEGWDLGGGFSLVAQQTDLYGDMVWFSLKKNGTELDDTVIDAGSSSLQDRVYTYTGNVSGVADTPIFSCYVSAVFSGTCSDLVQIKYVFLIDDNVTGIRTGDDYGTMEVKTVSSSGITLKNDVPIDLTPNTTTPIMGNLSFKTADNTGAIEFYPHLIRDEPPIHSGGGGFVLDDCWINSPWNLSENYSIAAKDVSLGGDKARIVILKNGVMVGEALLTEELRAPVDSDSYYSYVKNGTEIINVTLKAAFLGSASNVVGLAEVYQRSEADGSILINNASHLFKSADPAGIPWDLADGYVLAMKDVGFNDDGVWLELSKNGTVVEEEILNEDSASMFVYTSGTGSVTCMVDCVFRGCEANAVKLVNLSQYSDINGTALIVDESHFYRSADPDGMAWELMDEYVLTMKDLEDQHGLFHGGDKVWLELSKDGIMSKEDILESGDPFEYENGLESVDCMVEAVFKGSLADVVKLKNVNQYSGNGTQLIENGSKTYMNADPAGDVWELYEGYSFVPKDIDIGDKAWLSLLKDGVLVKDAIVDSEGDGWFEYHNTTGALVFRAYLDAVFCGADSNIIQLTYVSQYSEINGSVLIMFDEDDQKTLSTPRKLPKTWTVDDSGGADFTSIQAAIDSAISGDTVYVYAGAYSENVVVNKQLTLEGEGAEVVTVTNRTSDSPVFNVTADYVNISGFTVTGATGYYAGIYLGGVEHCTISSNNVLINHNGIYLYHSDNNTIIDNNVSSSIGCGSGILLRSSDSNCIINNNASNNEYPGIYLVASGSNTITGNTLLNNTACNYTYGALELYFSSSSNTITNNTIIDNVGNGIRIWDSSNSNTLTNNIIESNNHYGVYLSSSSNLVFHNNLVTNSNNAYDSNPANNDWHHQVLLEGNYWSDYTGADDGSGTGKHGIAGDGIGDTDVPHPAGHFDFYPFTNKSGWSVPVNELNIAQARADKLIHTLNETVTISCVVQNETGCNITTDSVDAKILKPDSSIEWITMAEGLVGHYNGTFTNTSLDGTYNVTIHVDKTGYVNDTAEFWFEVSTSQVRELDTGSGTYPSISGRHTGTIKPLHDVINICTMYTYPCAGTGGHSEYVRLFGNGVDVNGTWNGYSGDYHRITFPEQFTLLADHTYNYTIETGSYPQIHHTAILTTPDGEITCTEFVDANGKRYNTRIPAFRLE